MVAEAHLKTVDIIYRYEARDTAARPLPMDSDAALRRLNGGNGDFAALLDHVRNESGIQQIIPVDPRDLGLDSDAAGIPKQRPFAAVLGCSDARVPIELIFNEGPNDLFVIRVAGNGLGMEVLGSLKYAVDLFLNPGDYLALAAKHSIRSILDRSLIVVQASANRLLSAFGDGVTRNPGYRQALIEASIVTNAALSAYSIQQEFVTHDLAGLQAVYGVYVLETREVWAPSSGNVKGTGLASPPRDVAGFAAFSDAVVQSERIASYLKSGASD
jgi:carbonic anhydrase